MFDTPFKTQDYDVQANPVSMADDLLLDVAITAAQPADNDQKLIGYMQAARSALRQSKTSAC